MACDVSLYGEEMEDCEEEEDWTSTEWADPNSNISPNMSGSLGQHKIRAQNQVLNTRQGADGISSIAQPKTGESTIVKRMLLNDNKAGMEGLDKDRINQIIHEASKGSKFYENERQKEEQMKRRIEEQKQKIQHISAEQLRQGTAEADRLLEDFEQQRDLSRTIVHIDMDAFYAAVEIRDDPSLKNKPMAVGGNSMLSTSNYHARKFGVRAAMPGFIARKLCPELVIVPLNFDKYTAVSKQVKAVMSEYDPNFCPMSLDEAYLDLTEHLEKRQNMLVEERTFICRDSKYADSRAHCKCDLNEIARNYGTSAVSEDDSADFNTFFSKSGHFQVKIETNNGACSGRTECAENGGRNIECPKCKKEFPPFKFVTFGLSDEDAVNELRTRIEQKTTLTASAGIAPNMMLAKVCSDKNKPNGQYKIKASRGDVMDFIKDLPTRKISGIGKVSEAMLNAVGVYSCTDLYEKRGLLYHLYSQISFNYFMRICLGIGSTTVERTFSEISRPADLYQKCEELCESLSEDLKSEQLKGKTVSIKIKTVKFDVRTRAHTVRDYTNDYEDIVRSAFELLKTEIQNCSPQPLRLRLMGVRMSNLLHESLCQGKKQNTIIGAFKRLAKPVLKLEADKEVLSVKDIDMCQTQNQPSVVNQQTGTTGAVADNALGKAHGEAAISSMETDTVDAVKDIDDIGNRAKSKLKQSGTADYSGTSLDMTIDEIKLPSAEGYIAADIVSELDAVVEKPAEYTENSVQKHKDINEGLIVSGKEDEEFDRIICDKDMKADEIVPDAKADREKTLILENCASEKKEVSLYSPNVRKTRSGFIRTPVSQARKKKRKGGKRQDSAVTYECPVCSLNILCESLQVFNEHVDNCLESGKSDKHGGCVVEKLNVIKQETELNHDIGSKSELKPETVTEKEGTSDAYDSFETVARETTLYGNLENVYLDSAVEEIKDISCTETAKEETESTVKLESNDRGLESETDNKDQSELLSSNCNTEGPENSPCYYNSPKEIAQRIDTVENSNTDTHDINSVCDSSVDFDTKINSEHDNVMLVNGEDSTKVSKVRTHLNTHVDNEFEENRITNDKLTDYQSETGTLLNRTSESEPGAFKGLSLDKWEQTTVIGIELEINNMDGQEMAETESVSVIPISPKIIVKNGAKISDDYFTKTDSNLNNKAVTQDGNSMAQILHTKLEFPSCSTQAEKEQFQGKGSGLDKRKYQTVLSDEIEEINDDDIREDETGEDGETEGSLLVCPICNIEQRSVDLNEFNSHVDMCLSRGAISEILKEQKKQDGGTLKRGSAAVTPGSAKAAKRRKTSMPNISKSCRSIASFFQEK